MVFRYILVSALVVFCLDFPCMYKILSCSFLQIFRILLGINVRVLLVLLFLGFGAVFYMGARTSPIIVFVFSVCIISFLFSIYLTKWVLSKDEGPPEMVQVCLFPYLLLVMLSLFYFFIIFIVDDQLVF